MTNSSRKRFSIVKRSLRRLVEIFSKSMASETSCSIHSSAQSTTSGLSLMRSQFAIHLLTLTEDFVVSIPFQELKRTDSHHLQTPLDLELTVRISPRENG